MNKNKLKQSLQKHPYLERYSRYFYTVIRHPERLEKKKSYGKLNGNKTIYLIRPNSEDCIQGLMSLFVQALRKIDYAKRNNFIPVVDYKNFKTQYSDGVHNAWDFFFTQPSEVSLAEVYQSKNVILSGVSLFKREDEQLYKSSIFFNSELCNKCHSLIIDNIRLSKEVKSIVEEESKKLSIKECLGIYIRGTDYTELKPAGEYIQPSIEEVIKKADEMIVSNSIKKIFLVTEDRNNYEQLKSHFGNMLQIVSFDTFVSNYDGKNYLSKSGVLNKDRKERGIDYLSKIVLLAKCGYLLSSITYGSIAAYAMNGGIYKEKYIFDLGTYK